MIEVAIISDLHWGVRNNSSFFLEQQEEFFYKIFFPYLESHNINHVWILGDFYENRKMINVKILNHVIQFLQEFMKRDIEVYCLIGNHDVLFKNTNSISSIIPTMQSFENIHIVKEFEEFEFDGVKVGLISWINQENRERCLQWLKTTESKIIGGHFEINNFEIIKGVVCHSGFNLDFFDRFDRVFSGHFHIRADNGLICYVGNPYQTNWGEYGYEKGFHVFTPKTNQLTFVKNPQSVFYVIQYHDNFETQDFDCSLIQNKIVRIYSDSKQTQNRKKFEMFIEKITNNCQSLEIIENKEVIINENDYEKNQGTDQIIKKFIETCTIDHLDTNLLQNIIFEIYQEALEKDARC